MKDTLHELAEQYMSALQDYLGGVGEAALERAYELGRRALTDGLGVLDMAAVHHQAMMTVLLCTLTPEESARTVKALENFFMESLSPFEMTHRAFREANTALRRLNETLKEVFFLTKAIRSPIDNRLPRGFLWRRGSACFKDVAMDILPVFLLRILNAASQPGGRHGMMYIIIRRPYAYLEEELRRAFEGQGDVKVIVDRRYREQRASQQPVAVERRQADRRRPKEELVEVVIFD